MCPTLKIIESKAKSGQEVETSFRYLMTKTQENDSDLKTKKIINNFKTYLSLEENCRD